MIDPLSLSMSFAKIVTLLGQFKQEQKSKKDLDYHDFMEWCGNHDEEIKKFIVNNIQIFQDTINELLSEDHAEILEKLEILINDKQEHTKELKSINEKLSRIEELNSINEKFSQIYFDPSKIWGIEENEKVKTFDTNLSLSEQALSILHQFVDSGRSEIVHCTIVNAIGIVDDGVMSISDPQFVNDDLSALEALSFIRLSGYNDSGYPIYSITRKGDQYSKSVR